MADPFKLLPIAEEMFRVEFCGRSAQSRSEVMME